MDKKQFWATKSPLPEFHAITFTHPSFDAPFRLVANQFEAVTLGGYVHTPAPMSITPPEQGNTAQPKLTMVFPRAVVGREFKRQLRLVQDSGSRAPISISYAVYLGDTTTPQITWELYASQDSGIAFSTDGVQVSATVDNPLRRNVSVIYDPSVFSGLEIL